MLRWAKLNRIIMQLCVCMSDPKDASQGVFELRIFLQTTFRADSFMISKKWFHIADCVWCALESKLQLLSLNNLQQGVAKQHLLFQIFQAVGIFTAWCVEVPRTGERWYYWDKVLGLFWSSQPQRWEKYRAVSHSRAGYCRSDTKYASQGFLWKGLLRRRRIPFFYFLKLATQNELFYICQPLHSRQHQFNVKNLLHIIRFQDRYDLHRLNGKRCVQNLYSQRDKKRFLFVADHKF